VADATEILRRAEEIAEEVLFADATAVDTADRVPAAHLDLLAAEGFYGVAATFGEDLAVMGGILGAFAGGCLATAFVWLQHHTAVRLTADPGSPGAAWHEPLRRGEVRSGIALGGLRPGAHGLRVRAGAPGRLRLDGEVPWVTGWGLVDVVVTGAVDDAGTVHFVLMDATEAATLHAERLVLSAANASRTVTLRLRDHEVPAQRVLARQPHDAWLRGEVSGSALNGFLALGVAARAARLAGSSALDTDLAECGAALARAVDIPAARARAAHLAVRAAARAMVHAGSRGVLAGHHASRLVREAAFLLVFGTRPAIRDELLSRL